MFDEVNMGIEICLTEIFLPGIFYTHYYGAKPPRGVKISTTFCKDNGAGVTRTTLAKSNAKKQEIKQGGM